MLALAALVALASSATAQPATPTAPVAPSAPVAPAGPVAPVAPVVPPAAPPAAPPRTTAPLQNASQARQGVVRLERAGRRLGLGAVLRSDGRILSALSALGHGNFIRARFADDSTLAVRVIASDRAWDLALLAPEGGHWAEGLRASTLDAPEVGAPLYRFRVRGAHLEEVAVGVAAREAALGRDGVMLTDVLALSPRLDEDELGSPLFDAQGDVAAIVVQACAPDAQTCQLVGYGAPVSALRQFLKKAPRREPLPAAHVGVRGVAAHDGAVAGVRVIATEAGSPAERAGLRGQGGSAPGSSEAATGDLIVAVEDAPVATPEELRDAINRFAYAAPAASAAAHGSGADAGGEATARLLVFGSGKFREVKLPVRTPRPLPAAPAAPVSAPSVPPAPSPATSVSTSAAAPSQAGAPAPPTPAPAPSSAPAP